MWQTISTAIADLSNNPWVTISSWVISILSFLALFIKRGQRIKRPAYAVEERIVIGDNAIVHAELSIRFRDRPVPNLAVTTISIWNEGAEAVLGTDFSTNDPLRIIKPDDAEILHAELRSVTSPALGVALGTESGDGSIPIRFEHLGQYDGCQVAIMHTVARTRTLGVRGTCINVGPIVPSRELVPRRGSRFFLFTGVGFGLLVAGSAFDLKDVAFGLLFLVILFVVLFEQYLDRREFRYEQIFQPKPPHWWGSRIAARLGLGASRRP